jgi:hypothetical protein
MQCHKFEKIFFIGSFDCKEHFFKNFEFARAKNDFVGAMKPV